MEDYVILIYGALKDEFGRLDSIYEDAIIHLVGVLGLQILKENNLIETCGVINGRQLYVICEKHA